MLSFILYSIVKYLSIVIIILTAFSLCFFCIFNSDSNFSNPLYSLVYTMFVMLQGELGQCFNYFMSKQINVNLLKTSSHNTEKYIHILDVFLESIILLIFMFVCIIGLLNMLVGLTVREGRSLILDGHVFRQYLLIYWCHNLEKFFESRLFTVLSKTKLTYLFGIPPQVKEMFSVKLSYTPMVKRSSMLFSQKPVSEMKKSRLQIIN